MIRVSFESTQRAQLRCAIVSVSGASHEVCMGRWSQARENVREESIEDKENMSGGLVPNKKDIGKK